MVVYNSIISQADNLVPLYKYFHENKNFKEMNNYNDSKFA